MTVPGTIPTLLPPRTPDPTLGPATWWSWLLTAAGLSGLVLAGSRHRVGWAFGLVTQVLWVAYALSTAQHGFLASAACYGTVYARNWWHWRHPDPDPPRDRA